MNKNLFSIVIPTRQRHDTLKFAIQSVLNQTYPDFELVIMDNYSTSDTFDVVNSYQDERIKYYRASDRLSMSDNWESGISYATGEYIFVLGDDDALMPDGLEISAKLLADNPVEILSWLRCSYGWPNAIVSSIQSRLFLGLSQDVYLCNGKETLHQFYKYQISHEFLPMMYNSFVHRDLIDRIKSIHGRYFMSAEMGTAPDLYSGLVNAYFTDRYLFSHRPISTIGSSGHSIGASVCYPNLNNNARQAFIKDEKQDLSKKVHRSLTPSLNQEIGIASVIAYTQELFFSEDRRFKLDIKDVINGAAKFLNRDVGEYDNVYQSLKLLAEKYNLDLAQFDIPAKVACSQNNHQGYQGKTSNSSLIVNCEQVGITDVADAVKLAWGILPNPSEIQVHELANLRFNNRGVASIIAIDSIFFQLYNTGIARVWKSLLEEWANTEFGSHLVVLDRAGTSPKVDGISYYQIPAYNYHNTDADRQMLQQVCNEIGAELFVSTYYTTPLETPSVFMGYDLIPEVMGWDLNQPMWQEKRRAIAHASAYLTISAHTAQDLVEIYPEIDRDTVTVAHCGTQSVFTTQSSESIDVFRNKYGIDRPYFILIGSNLDSYKNGILFWQGFSQLTNTGKFDIICTGAAGSNAEELKQYAPDSNIHHLRLDDDELSIAYAGAIALVYPSKYEGFGLPIVEAFASGCPVITCPNASIPEVAGEAAIYVFDEDIDGMAEALCEVQKPQVRAALIAAGLEQVKQFSWAKMGDIVRSVLVEQTLAHLPLGQDNLIIFPDWSQDEEELGEEITSICHNLAQSSQFERPTLLIDTSKVEDLEAANMLISSVVMNLMMSADLDLTEHLELALTGELAPIQWGILLPKIQGRIKLELEDTRSIDSAGANLLQKIELIAAPVLALV
jgi:glycosyltransferase involved in cell wall biosynthesis